MARFDENARYTPDYQDDCSSCGREFDRGDLAWVGDELMCDPCERKTETAVRERGFWQDKKLSELRAQAHSERAAGRTHDR